MSNQRHESLPFPSISREDTLPSFQPILTDVHPPSSFSGSCSLGATSAVVDGEVQLLPPSSQNPPVGVGPDNSVGSNVSVSSEAAIADSSQNNSPPQAPLPPPSSQHSSKTVDSDVSESFESEAATSDSAKSNDTFKPFPTRSDDYDVKYLRQYS